MTYADMHLTIRYESGADGWTIARIPEIPGAMSQGRTREEAREMVIDALRTLLSGDADSDQGDIEELPFALNI